MFHTLRIFKFIDTKINDTNKFNYTKIIFNIKLKFKIIGIIIKFYIIFQNQYVLNFKKVLFESF